MAIPAAPASPSDSGSQSNGPNLFPMHPPRGSAKPPLPTLCRPGMTAAQKGFVWKGDGVQSGVRPVIEISKFSILPPETWQKLLDGKIGVRVEKPIMSSRYVRDDLTLPHLSRKQAEQINRGVMITVCGVGITWAMVETGALTALLALL